MVIDPKAEQPARAMLGYALRGELDDLAALIRAEGTDILPAAIPLFLLASAYIAIDVSGRWPTEADTREIAKAAAQSVTRLDIAEQEIYEYLSRVALSQDKLDDVFAAEGLATIPLYATANLLLTFCPRDKEWWEYLDQIWNADAAADRTSLTVLPALLLRARKQASSEDASAR
jgi:hypothetical protein